MPKSYAAPILLFACLSIIGCTGLPQQRQGQIDAETLTGMARSAVSKGEYDQAIKFYRQAEMLDNDSSEIKLALANLALKTSRWSAAEVYFQALNVRDPEQHDVLVGLGIALLKQRKFAEAETEFKSALALQADSPLAFNYLGVIADLTGQSSSANEYYLTALEFEPANTVFMNNFGYSLLQQKRYDEAEYWLRTALALGGENVERVRNNLAIVIARQFRYAEALALLSDNGEDPIALSNLGYIALLNEDYTRAISLLEDALSFDPENGVARASLERAKQAQISAKSKP